MRSSNLSCKKREKLELQTKFSTVQRPVSYKPLFDNYKALLYIYEFQLGSDLCGLLFVAYLVGYWPISSIASTPAVQQQLKFVRPACCNAALDHFLCSRRPTKKDKKVSYPRIELQTHRKLASNLTTMLVSCCQIQEENAISEFKTNQDH